MINNNVRIRRQRTTNERATNAKSWRGSYFELITHNSCWYLSHIGVPLHQYCYIKFLPSKPSMFSINTSKHFSSILQYLSSMITKPINKYPRQYANTFSASRLDLHTNTNHTLRYGCYNLHLRNSNCQGGTTMSPTKTPQCRYQPPHKPISKNHKN